MSQPTLTLFSQQEDHVREIAALAIKVGVPAAALSRFTTFANNLEVVRAVFELVRLSYYGHDFNEPVPWADCRGRFVDSWSLELLDETALGLNEYYETLDACLSDESELYLPLSWRYDAFTEVLKYYLGRGDLDWSHWNYAPGREDDFWTSWEKIAGILPHDPAWDEAAARVAVGAEKYGPKAYRPLEVLAGETPDGFYVVEKEDVE